MTAPTVRGAVNATAITMGLHALCTVAMAVPALLAPIAAADFGTDASRVGVLVACIYAGIVPGSLACGWLLQRLGNLRACQLSAWLCALALLVAALAGWAAGAGGAAAEPSGNIVPMTLFVLGMLLVASMLQGFGYGLLNPVGSQILFRAAPPEIRSLVFSIKQSAVPIGQMLAGLIIPSLLLFVAWQPVVLIVGLMIAVYGVAMFGMRIEGAPDREKRPDHAARGLNAGTFLEPLRTVWTTPALRELALIGAVYSANQLCLLSFLVSYLNLEIGLSLVLAGTLFSLAQAGSMIGRLSWGIVADRWVSPRVQVGALGVIGGLCGIVTATFSPSWLFAGIAVVSILYGATAVVWNGVFFAEVARLCPRGEVGKTTGGLQVYMSVGAGLGPLLFSMLVSATGTYAAGFAVFALPSLWMGAMLVAKRGRA